MEGGGGWAKDLFLSTHVLAALEMRAAAALSSPADKVHTRDFYDSCSSYSCASINKSEFDLFPHLSLALSLSRVS
jgi:hypothetical protein